MRFYKAVFLASISKTIADLLSVPDSMSFTTDSSLADNTEWNALSRADPALIASADTGNSGSLGSVLESQENSSPDDQNGLDIGFIPNPIAAVNIANSNKGCSSDTASNGLQQVQQCVDNLEQEFEERKRELEDKEDAEFAEEFLKRRSEENQGKNYIDKNAESICKAGRLDARILPLCCRGPQRIAGEGSTATIMEENCVVYIEGRPRCRYIRDRKCCWLLGVGFGIPPTMGIDCRQMLQEVI